ncbi:MAG TPA: CcmD family protein [Bryobacteraceae bacterium]|nr:CcmD family protein [Bryobacteraceae bacterium]
MVEARNLMYMFYGFLAAWVVLVGYVVTLVVRERNLKNELAQVRNMLKDRERPR